jgi:hypothetical protein
MAFVAEMPENAAAAETHWNRNPAGCCRCDLEELT